MYTILSLVIGILMINNIPKNLENPVPFLLDSGTQLADVEVF